MTEPLRIAIAGVAGRMGQTLVRTVLVEGHDLVGGTEVPTTPVRDTDLARLVGLPYELGVTPVTDVVEAARDARVWIDFTRPDATLAALDALRHTPVHAVIIGTTGFDAKDEARIARAAEDMAVVKAGNFSLGVNLLTALARLAAARLGGDWDAEVLETHHRRKVDAPSGTALMLGQAVAEGRGQTLAALRSPPYDGPDARRMDGTIGFAVRRSGGVVGEHEVTFASDREVIALGHQALDRSVFAAGALHAAGWAMGQAPGLYDMEDVLDLKRLGGSG